MIKPMKLVKTLGFSLLQSLIIIALFCSISIKATSYENLTDANYKESSKEKSKPIYVSRNDGKSGRLLEKTGETKQCKASWYGDYFQGRLTANGERFDKNLMTAAHKKMPFNTYLLVTNRKNNKKVIVRINDRGPYIHGREIDLSEAAANELGGRSQGVLDIEYEILSKVS